MWGKPNKSGRKRKSNLQTSFRLSQWVHWKNQWRRKVQASSHSIWSEISVWASQTNQLRRSSKVVGAISEIWMTASKSIGARLRARRFFARKVIQTQQRMMWCTVWPILSLVKANLSWLRLINSFYTQSRSAWQRQKSGFCTLRQVKNSSNGSIASRKWLAFVISTITTKWTNSSAKASLVSSISALIASPSRNMRWR